MIDGRNVAIESVPLLLGSRDIVQECITAVLTVADSIKTIRDAVQKLLPPMSLKVQQAGKRSLMLPEFENHNKCILCRHQNSHITNQLVEQSVSVCKGMEYVTTASDIYGMFK